MDEIASRQEISSALRGMLQLVEDRDLARNTLRDADALFFMTQATKISRAINEALAVLEKYDHE